MNTNNLPQKPDNAVWNAQDNQWELGQKNAAGIYIGEWMWWMAPTNHLLCHTFFDDNGNILNYTRYHIDGAYSEKGTYKNAVRHGTFYYQASNNETTEDPIPSQAPQGTFRMEYEFEMGDFVSDKYFNMYGAVSYIPKKWSDSEDEYQGNRMLMKKNGALRWMAGVLNYDMFCSIAFKFLYPKENGLPNIEKEPELNDIESDIFDIFETDLNSIVTKIITTSGFIEFVFFSKNIEEFYVRLERLQIKYKQYIFTSYNKKDKNWETYDSF